MSVAVVIPYFQRERGLLVRALTSIAAQEGVDTPRVIVVDDGSPIPASEELAALPGSTSRLRIEVVYQPNAGPAQARNRGLDVLGADVIRVAFLDSDDTWRAQHLADAKRALDAGHDVYFSDFQWPGVPVGAFARAGRIDVNAHPLIAGSQTLHAYRDDMVDQVIRGNIIGTPTVVYAFDRFRGLRFDMDQYSAGEDYLFWIALARAGARFAFSSRIGVDIGHGVNIYSSAGWGSDRFLNRVQNEMRYRKKLFALDLDATQRAHVRAKVLALRRDFAMGTLFGLLRRHRLDPAMLKTQWQLDPMSLLAIPIEAGKAAASRLRAAGTRGAERR